MTIGMKVGLAITAGGVMVGWVALGLSMLMRREKVKFKTVRAVAFTSSGLLVIGGWIVLFLR